MTNSAPNNVKILYSLQIKNPNTIANTRLRYLIGVTNDARLVYNFVLKEDLLYFHISP